MFTGIIEAMGDAYPQLKEKAEFIRKGLRIEEESFLKTRNRGQKMLDELIDRAGESGSKQIAGSDAFKLWDTYGFPYDMTKEIAEDAGLSVDRAEFDAELEKQRERGRKSWQGADVGNITEIAEKLADEIGVSNFTGYEQIADSGCTVQAIIVNGERVEKIDAGTDAVVVLDTTPFYAESGGQIGDTGRLESNSGAAFDVRDTQKASNVFMHFGTLESGSLTVGDKVGATIDAVRRMAIRRNHSTTHLLQAALKKHVGSHVTQAGSYVGPEGLRFDFSHPEGLEAATLRKIQDDVNAMILADYPVKTDVMPLEEAKKRGAIAPFGEKYGPTVRVVQMGDQPDPVSMEFCGGVHLDSTIQAARFRIVNEGSIASGVRRIEATTGHEAIRLDTDEQFEVVEPLQAALAVKGTEVVDRVTQLARRVKELEKELTKERQKGAMANLDKAVESAEDIEGARVVVARLDGMKGNELRNVGTSLRDKLGDNGVAIVLSENDGKVGIVAAVGKDAQKKFPAGKVVNAFAGPLGGKGGGKPDVAQGGAADASKIDDVIGDAAKLLGSIA